MLTLLPLVPPPVARTVPSGSTVRLCMRRANSMPSVLFQAGEAARRSMISAVLVAGLAAAGDQDLAIVVDDR